MHTPIIPDTHEFTTSFEDIVYSCSKPQWFTPPLKV